MANYFGYGLKGFAGGLGQGFSMGVTMQEIRWKKKAEEDLKKAKEEAKIAINELMVNPANQEYFGSMQDDPYSATGVQLVTSLIALNKDMGNYVADVQKAINEGNHKEEERLLEEFKIRVDAIKELNLSGMSANPDFGLNISSPEGLKMINMQKTYKETPKEKMPYAMTREMAETAGFKAMPEAMAPEERDLSEIEKKMNYAKMLNLDVKAKAKILGGGDSTFQQEIEAYYAAGGTDEGFRKRFERGTGIDIVMPPTVGTIGSWEERFNKAKTKDAYNRELANLAQSPQAETFTPPYPAWKGKLSALVKERAVIMERLLDEKGKLRNQEHRKDWDIMIKEYNKNIMELQTDYPDVDLGQYPKFKKWSTLGLFSLRDEKGW